MNNDYHRMTPSEREMSLRHLVHRSKLVQKERREVARILLASESAGAFGTGEMNAYVKRISGVDIREELQGVYEAFDVLRDIRDGSLPVTEHELETWGYYPVIMLSGFMSKRPQKVPQFLEIIRPGQDLTNRLKELRAALPQNPEPPRP